MLLGGEFSIIMNKVYFGLFKRDGSEWLDNFGCFFLLQISLEGFVVLETESSNGAGSGAVYQVIVECKYGSIYVSTAILMCTPT
jgi:hypothetical protein